MQPKVSVIVPVYNNQVFVVTCVKSLLAQTLENIEVICINDGSTDDSSKILHEFADHDPRVIVVDKENGGYGVGINTGLDLARGEYVTILESDDFADLDMLETLTNLADAFDLEVVRANFYLYWSKKLKNDHLLELFGNWECDRVIDPSNREDQHCFYVQPALWSAIYRRSFIEENKLRLLETPGAAYQDTAFNFKIWACARRVMFVHKPFVHYRQDNESSSINNPGKVDTICLEYAEIRRWLREERPELHDAFAPIATKMMCDAYTWNTKRVAKKFQLGFVERFGREFAEAEERGEVDPSRFAPGQLSMVKKTVTDPQGFADFHTRGIDPERGLELLERKVGTLVQVAQQDGLRPARDLVKSKISGWKPEYNVVDARDNEMATRKEPKFLKAAPEPRISVVMPVYKCEAVLGETLDSVLAQTMGDFELICVNDGATDGSRDILARYADADARVRIIDQENRGVANARNRGLQEVNAPYILILDSDDIFVPTMFELLLDQAVKTEADIVACSSCEYDGEKYLCTPTPWTLKLDKLPEKEVFSPEDAGDELFEAFMGWPWDRLYRTEFLKGTGIEFPEDYDNSEDGVFVYGVLVRAKALSVVPDVLIKHRSTRKGSISNSREKSPECFYRAVCAIKDDLKAEPGRYERFEKSFLNWALDYTMWNIVTLHGESARRALAKKLVSGGFPELEVKDHPWSFFDLYGKGMRRRYLKLQMWARGL